MHSILARIAAVRPSDLTYEMENKRQGCINRDRNSCRNMRKIFEHHMKHGVRSEGRTAAMRARIERYCRGFEIKCSNPESVVLPLITA